MPECGAQHPELPLVCSVERSHADHAAWSPQGWVSWPNEDYVSPLPPPKTEKSPRKGRGHVLVMNIENAMKTNLEGQETAEEGDEVRLGHQLVAVMRHMLDGEWHTLPEISTAIDAPEASISARIRDMRKPEFGSVEVDRMRSPQDTLFHYRVNPEHLDRARALLEQEAPDA